MSLQDDVAAVRRRLDDLARTVGRLERDLARQRPEADHGPDAAPGRPEGLVPLSGPPYGTSPGRDPDDEGPGARHRGAP
ncbi:hypothetical protein [Streptomyces roseolilacinus]|uniref:hypothetical protein n=1 Tax=Streptomyces roseolilacinus TaxID=66904 RepID=UPI0037F983D2